MIDERLLSQKFKSFWNELLPMLTPSVVHVINTCDSQRALIEDGKPLGPVEMSAETRDPAVIAETGYHIARIAYEQFVHVADVVNDPEMLGTASSLAIESAKRFSTEIVDFSDGLSSLEVREAMRLAYRQEVYRASLADSATARYALNLPGAGFLSPVQIDLATSHFLVEVKAVNRNLTSKDIRQVVTYILLRFMRDGDTWENVAFLNTRLGFVYEFPTQSLLRSLSGDKSIVELSYTFRDFLFLNDVQIGESRF
ncbi:hypothetical protein [Algisphaera agarilytica]|uniref:Uncharacterized protein n=1 Tax=Algisphaera agarilytica TaxID=1385975 RepID=A0A7X0H8W8_9BACT|nr:hypothetical protein [Algisphaera agarilytica]MBB6431381.1 hypothetical protein [Algisphaera agarilytica]